MITGNPFPRSLRHLLAWSLTLAGLGLAVPPPVRAAADSSEATAAPATVATASLPKFSTSTSLKSEAMILVDMLERVHYNRDAVRSTDYVKVVGNYMGEGLDGWDRQRLFFLAGDKASFQERYNTNLYYNLANLGNIDAAYEIFYLYRERVNERVDWVLDQLKKDYTFDSDQTYHPDRTDAPWAASMADLDQIWQRRLKYELLDEVLTEMASREKKAAEAKDQQAAADGASTDPTAGAGKAAASASPAATAATSATAAAAKSAEKEQTPLEVAKDVVRKRYERLRKTVNEYEGPDVAERFLMTVAELYDPHSTYYNYASFEDFGIQMKLELFGIGAELELSQDGNYCKVNSIIPGGPAALDKRLKAGDRIVAVAQAGEAPVDVIGWNLRKIVQLIRGPKGTDVRLTIWPADSTDSSDRRDIELTRDLVKLNSTRAHGAIFEVPGDDGTISPLGVITLPLFYGGNDEGDDRSATTDVAALIKQMQAAGIKGLVLDLRHNGGGLLSEAISLTGLFIRQGPVVQVKDYDGHINIDRDTDPSIAYDGPLAVLVDRFSASASEIVAGALQNYGRAIIVGESSTHGKGTVQTIVDLKNTPLFRNSPEKHGAIKLTIQKFYLPNGSSTQLKGVVPDIIIPSTDDLLEKIGERDMPNALGWDEIRPAAFDGHALSAQILEPLKAASENRELTLEEFSYLRKNIDWFKKRQEELKAVSLNLADRESQKAADDAFTDAMTKEHDRLAKDDSYPDTEFRLAPPPPKEDTAASDDANADDSSDEAYDKLDIPLRESFRILNDAIQLAKTPPFEQAAQAPLTANPGGPRS